MKKSAATLGKNVKIPNFLARPGWLNVKKIFKISSGVRSRSRRPYFKNSEFSSSRPKGNDNYIEYQNMVKFHSQSHSSPKAVLPMLSAVNLCAHILRSCESDFSTALPMTFTNRSLIESIMSNIIFILPEVNIGVSFVRLSRHSAPLRVSKLICGIFWLQIDLELEFLYSLHRWWIADLIVVHPAVIKRRKILD